ncbi:MAG TPA: sigma-70 family RNA polymerase sigma factor [Terriglobales bacterium]|nr:sigma-70 family RNA polymerase sigma factor [Terriglobales bacterium]
MRAEIEQAIELLQSGNNDATEQALALLQNTVFAFSMRVCGQREDAEDTMQEVLVRTVSQLPKFSNGKALVVWLYKVAKTRCLMSRRRSKFAPEKDLSLEQLMPDRHELQHLGAEGSLNPEAFAIRSQEAGRLRDAIQKLPPPYRIVLVLRDMEGLSDDEVAEITGLRPGTIRVRLHRARLFVRKELLSLRKPKRGRSHTPPAVPNAMPDRARCKALFAELSDYLDEQLDDSLCAELAEHMNACEPCKVFLATLQATIEGCRQVPAQNASQTVAARLRKDLVQKYKEASAVLKSRSAPPA